MSSSSQFCVTTPWSLDQDNIVHSFVAQAELLKFRNGRGRCGGPELKAPGPSNSEGRMSAQYPNKFIVYYESRKRELKIRLMNEGRCDERLKAGVQESA